MATKPMTNTDRLSGRAWGTHGYEGDVGVLVFRDSQNQVMLKAFDKAKGGEKFGIILSSAEALRLAEAIIKDQDLT